MRDYGLTSGFYGSLEESKWFFDTIQAGVTYAIVRRRHHRRLAGLQPFGGWKGSGSSGKNAGAYTTPAYMREQIQTLIAEPDSELSALRQHHHHRSAKLNG